MNTKQLLIVAWLTVASSAFGQGWNIDVIDSGSHVGLHNSLAFDPSGKMTISYYDATDLDEDGDPGDLRLWHDDNGNDLFDDGEARTIDSIGDVGLYTSLAFDSPGHATVAYYDETNADLKLWHDGDGDFYIDPGETQTIDSGGDVGQYPSLAFDGSGNATISYDNNDLKLWHDVNGDFEFDPGEIEVIDDVGLVSSLGFDSAGFATVSYQGHNPEGDSALLVWHDADGDFTSDPTEIEVIDSQYMTVVGRNSSLTFDADGHVTVSYLKGDTGSSLYLWHDADGDFAYDGGEIQAIDAPFYYNRTFLRFDALGLATVAYYTGEDGPWGSSTAKVWHDANGDFGPDAGEIQAIGELGSPRSLAFDGSGQAAVTGTSSSAGFRLWHDTDGDFAYDDGEIQQIDQAQADVGQFAKLAFDASGRMTVVYQANFMQTYWSLWHDVDGSLASDPNEISESVGGGRVRLMFDNSGLLIVTYLDGVEERTELWHDANGDFVRDAGEIHVVATWDEWHDVASGDFALDALGRVTAAYRRFAGGFELAAWHDADENFTVDPGEIQTIDAMIGQYGSVSLVFDASGYATVSYHDDISDDLQLWHDADGDFAYDNGEIQTIDSEDAGRFNSLAFNGFGHAIVSYRGDSQLKLWHDADGDFAFDAGEIHAIGAGLIYDSSLALDASDRVTVAYRTLNYVAKVWHDADGDYDLDGGEIEELYTDVGAPFGQLGFRNSDQLAVIAFYANTLQALMLASHLDWDGDGVEIPDDNCRLFNPDQIDCQPNDVGDVCDIADGTSLDDNGNGIPDECEPAIPTISEWGLIVMTLLLITSGTLVYRSRRSVAA